MPGNQRLENSESRRDGTRRDTDSLACPRLVLYHSGRHLFRRGACGHALGDD